MIDNINWGKRVLSKYINFHIRSETSLSEQLLLLDEDLVQICYDGTYILDVGWYPAFNLEGSFKVVVIMDNDWDNPIITKECREIETLKTNIEECVCIIQSRV